MYSYNKLIVLRLQVIVGNLILELSIRFVRKRGVETRMRARITRVIKVYKWRPSAQCSVSTTVVLVSWQPYPVDPYSAI